MHAFCVKLLTLSFVLVFICSASSMRAQIYTTLHDFQKTSLPPDGGSPDAPGLLAQGRDGNLYGTTEYGGTYDDGVIFKITPSGSFSVLYSFNGLNDSESGVVLGTDGNFYGATAGSVTGPWCGALFKISPTGSFVPIVQFDGTYGCHAVAPPIQAVNGNFYGFSEGGAYAAWPPYYPYFYKITLPGAFIPLAPSTTTSAPLVQGTDGNFYGVDGAGTNNLGSVFRMSATGVRKVLYNFDGTHGSGPVGLIQASDGNFYGTTSEGGSLQGGVVFKITSKGGTPAVLHEFDLNNPVDGAEPYAGLVQATDGKLYGAAYWGGALGGCCGVLFRISTRGTYEVLRRLNVSCPPANQECDGTGPESTPMQHTNGKIYGTSRDGGMYGYGTVYSLDVGLNPFVKLMTQQGKAGQVVQILGQGFTGTTSVLFGTGSAAFAVVSDTYMTAKVPTSGTTGVVTVTTPTGTLTSNTIFKVIPTLTSFTPLSGPVGSTVTITGTGLTQTSKVTFGGVKATFTVNSGTQVTATVPVGAVTGKIAVTTPGGTASKGTFTVI